MPKTRREIVIAALQRIEILSADADATAEQFTYVGGALDALIAELIAVHGMASDFDVETTPDGAFLPLSFLLAVEIGPHFLVQTEPRHRAMGRLRAFLHPDDRGIAADLDGDGTVTDAEQAAHDRAAYY